MIKNFGYLDGDQNVVATFQQSRIFFLASKTTLESLIKFLYYFFFRSWDFDLDCWNATRV